MYDIKRFVWGPYMVAMIGLVVLGFAAAPVWADDYSTPSPAVSDRAADKTLDMSASTDMSASQLKLQHARDLIGTGVQNSQGDKIGKINDIVLQQGQNKIDYAVLEAGGFLGMGDKYLAVPWTSLKYHGVAKDVSATGTDRSVSSDRDKDRYFILNVDKDAIKQAKGFDKDNFPAKPDFSWLGASTAMSTTDTIGATASAGDMNQGQIIRLSQVMDWNVHSAQASASTSDRSADKSIGKIHDAMVDVNSGRLIYCLLELNDNAGKNLDNKWVALPWNALNIDYTAKVARVNVSTDTFSSFAFDKDHMPNLSDRSYYSRLHDQLGLQGDVNDVFGYVGDESRSIDQNKSVTPDKSVAPDQSRTPDMGPAAGGEERPLTHIGKYDVSSVVTLSGDVVADRPNEVNLTDKMTHFTMKTPSGIRDIIVVVAPQAFADQRNLAFRTGDHVTVTGSRSTVDGHDVIMAGKIERGGQIYLIRDAKGAPVWQSQGMHRDRDRGAEAVPRPNPDNPTGAPAGNY